MMVEQRRQPDSSESPLYLRSHSVGPSRCASPVFRSRLEHAADLYRRGVAPLVVVAGGKQEGDLYTEAAAGTRYLSPSMRGITPSQACAVSLHIPSNCSPAREFGGEPFYAYQVRNG